jgi:type IV secretory pathway VirB10-like protein
MYFYMFERLRGSKMELPLIDNPVGVENFWTNFWIIFIVSFVVNILVLGGIWLWWKRQPLKASSGITQKVDQDTEPVPLPGDKIKPMPRQVSATPDDLVPVADIAHPLVSSENKVAEKQEFVPSENKQEFVPMKNKAVKKQKFVPSENKAVEKQEFVPRENKAVKKEDFAPSENKAVEKQDFAPSENKAAEKQDFVPAYPLEPKIIITNGKTLSKNHHLWSFPNLITEDAASNQPQEKSLKSNIPLPKNRPSWTLPELISEDD